MVCNERQILKDHFDKDGLNGYDYAYKFPGMNKVLQSAGRVIRTVEDTGIVVLLDERFTERNYLRLFPREWGNYVITNINNIEDRILHFWKKLSK
jgi:Rad3-related DNA helicase